MSLLLTFVAVCGGCNGREELSSPDDLIRALGGARAVEPRLSGALYTSCESMGPAPSSSRDLVPEPNCPGSPASPHQLKRVLRAVDELWKRPLGIDGARALLLAEIVLRRSPRYLKAAVDRLENELRRDGTGSAEAWSDLAAAHLAIAQRQDDPIALFAALHAANRAVVLDSHNAEAHFNRALALEYLALQVPARNAWIDVSKFDHDGWVDEAHQRLVRLDREIQEAAMRTGVTKRLTAAALNSDARAGAELAHCAPEHARQLVERELLPRWAHAALTGNLAAANRDLAVAQSIVILLRPIDKDTLLGETLAAIDSASDNPVRLKALRLGHYYFGQGMALFKERRPELARPHFEAAIAEFVIGGSPFADWASLYLAICEYQGGKAGRAAEQLEELLAHLGVRTPALTGRVLWQLGLSEGVRGELASAAARLRVAADAFRQNRDSESLAAVENLLASTYDALGDHSRSWRHRYVALRSLAHGSASAERRWVVVKAVAESLVERDRPDLGLPILDELLRISGENPERKAQALLRRSTAFAHLGKWDSAERDHHAAEAAVAKISDPSLRARIGIDVLVGRAAVLAHRTPEVTLSLLNEARHFYDRTEHEFLLARVLLARARVAAVTGREAEAERDLEDALARAEGHFERIEAPDLKISFLSELQAAFEELLITQFPRDPEAAFATIERARSRVLLDRTGARPLNAAEVRASLPPGVALVEYALVHDRLLVWVLKRESIFTEVIEWASAGGPELMARFAGNISSGTSESDLRQQLGQIHNVLIRPIARHLLPESLLVIVPHGALANLPFPALLDAETRRYLIEDYPLVVAPSASLYVAALRRAQEAESQPVRSLLAIADPAFDRNWHTSLPSLQGARQEVSEIAQIYSPEALVLMGKAATPNALAAAVLGRDILHFAAHSVTNPRQPDQSALVLAPPGTDPSTGDLAAASIEHLPLANTRLVVLASCRGASGKIASGEGTLSLARSFLAAGASAVIAGLWEVNDQRVADLFVQVHEQLKLGNNAVTALRGAQIAMLHDSDVDRRSPLTWGGLQVFGAVVELRKTVRHPSNEEKSAPSERGRR